MEDAWNIQSWRKLGVMQAGLMFLREFDVWNTGLDGPIRVREPGECVALPRRWFTPSDLWQHHAFEPCGGCRSCVVLDPAVLRPSTTLAARGSNRFSTGRSITIMTLLQDSAAILKFQTCLFIRV